MYDLDKTGDIQPSEVKRLLVALLHNNPDIALDEEVIGQIVDQVSVCFFAFRIRFHGCCCLPIIPACSPAAACDRYLLGT